MNVALKKIKDDLPGGLTELSRILGITYNAIASWNRKDSIPNKHQIKIYNLGKERNLNITPSEIIGLNEEHVVCIVCKKEINALDRHRD